MIISGTILVLVSFIIVELSDEPVRKKRRKHSFAVPQLPRLVDSNWASRFNLNRQIVKTSDEVGDGGSSRVYKGFLGENMVAVKQLKFYSSRFASSVIAAYEGLFELSHSNVVKVLGICPKEGYIIMEYCEKVVNGITVRTWLTCSCILVACYHWIYELLQLQMLQMEFNICMTRV